MVLQDSEEEGEEEEEEGESKADDPYAHLSKKEKKKLKKQVGLGRQSHNGGFGAAGVRRAKGEASLHQSR